MSDTCPDRRTAEELAELQRELATVLGSPSLRVSAEIAKARQSRIEQLERELAEARKEIRTMFVHGNDLVRKANAERDQWREVAEGLFSHLDLIHSGKAPQYDFGGVEFNDSTADALDRFRKLKEASRG